MLKMIDGVLDEVINTSRMPINENTVINKPLTAYEIMNKLDIKSKKH